MSRPVLAARSVNSPERTSSSVSTLRRVGQAPRAAPERTDLDPSHGTHFAR
jgi:hypothetical protein